MDAFYAAVEERRNPDLRGRPIVVGADPKAGAGRGVVTTASYAARKYGIRSAMPITRAWRLAEAARRRGEPEAVFLRGDRAVYREVSDRIMAIAARGADAFEEASIDEAFLDLSSLGDFERAAVHARAVKAEVVEREGLTCSIGIGPNKLVAKIASDFQKPDGLTVVQPEAVQAFLDPLPIRRIPGIGPKSEAALRSGDPDDRRAARRRADAARGMVRQRGDGDGRAGARHLRERRLQ
jgi:DNA polymerase IV (DinB-like DNA polymerase)